MQCIHRVSTCFFRPFRRPFFFLLPCLAGSSYASARSCMEKDEEEEELLAFLWVLAAALLQSTNVRPWVWVFALRFARACLCAARSRSSRARLKLALSVGRSVVVSGQQGKARQSKQGLSPRPKACTRCRRAAAAAVVALCTRHESPCVGECVCVQERLA